MFDSIAHRRGIRINSGIELDFSNIILKLKNKEAAALFFPFLSVYSIMLTLKQIGSTEDHGEMGKCCILT